MSLNWRDEKPSTSTRLAVLGHPIAHSLSPKMHSAALQQLDIEASYVAFDVSPQDFENCIAHLRAAGYLGVNVTIPHKANAAQLSTPDDDIVAKTNSANVLKFGDTIQSRNTDAPGFLAPLEDSTPGRALVLGAGAAAATAVFALANRGWSVIIHSRSIERAKALANRFGATTIEEPNPTGCSLVVNATPVGLNKGEIPNLDWQNIDSATIYDLAYRSEPTDFLMHASQLGLTTIDGREMLVEQGALALEWWFDIEAPREFMREAVEL